MNLIRCQRGVSAVEFALVLPILLLLTFGIIEFGILLFDKAVITNASREGARAGVVFATDSSGNYQPKGELEIRTIVKNYADSLLINLGGTTTALDIKFFCKSPGSSTWTDGKCTASRDDLKVQLNFTYDFLILPDLSAVTGGSFTGPLALQAETVMRME